MTIENVGTIDEVNDHLNKDLVVEGEEEVPNFDDVDNALQQVANFLDDKGTKKYSSYEDQSLDNEENILEEEISYDDDDDDDDDDVMEKEAVFQDEEINESDIYEKDSDEDIDYKDDLMEKNARLIEANDKINKLEKQIEHLEKKVVTLEQLYARRDDFDDLDIHAMENEVESFTKAEKATMEEIEMEKNIDYTTPSGRYDYYKMKKERSNLKNKVNGDICSVCNDENCTCHSKTSSSCPVCGNGTCLCKEKKSSTSFTDSFEKLSGKNAQVFKKGICPFTNSKLIKLQSSGDYVGVYSEDGKEEYAVNTVSGTIYRHIR
jgi:DNA repair exonuclease SbcCD ATPase subunit